MRYKYFDIVKISNVIFFHTFGKFYFGGLNAYLNCLRRCGKSRSSR